MYNSNIQEQHLNTPIGMIILHNIRKIVKLFKKSSEIIIILAVTPEIGQGLGRILSCGARKPEQI